jgi:hypothetical protein
MTLKVTTLYFRFDASTPELHLNVFYDQTQRERNTSSSREIKHFLGFFSFLSCQRNFLLCFFF